MGCNGEILWYQAMYLPIIPLQQERFQIYVSNLVTKHLNQYINCLIQSQATSWT